MELLKLKNISVTVSDKTIDKDDESKSSFSEVRKSLCSDYRLYEQIFYHLISNAIKFSGNDTRITIETVVFANKIDVNGIPKMTAKL